MSDFRTSVGAISGAAGAFVVGALLLSVSPPSSAQSTVAERSYVTVAKATVAERHKNIALHTGISDGFTLNAGQFDASVRFLARGRRFTLFLTPNRAVLSLLGAEATEVVRISFPGANPQPEINGEQALPFHTNYFHGNDPSKWRSGVPEFERVRYRELYPGVDLVFHRTQEKELEHDFVVAPGTNPGVIRFRVEGAAKLTRDTGGDLIVHTPVEAETLRLRAPVAYQERDGQRTPVVVRYLSKSANEFGFEVGRYDPGRPLIIDPVLIYSTFLGGSSEDGAYGIAVDSAGNAYVVGDTLSFDFPVTPGVVLGSPKNICNYVGCKDAFITKLSPDGSQILFSTYLGGSGFEFYPSVAVDDSGNVYVTGQTNSTDFPIVNAFQTMNRGADRNAFIAKLNSTGSTLLYSTYLGGSNTDFPNAIAVDANGNAYVAGSTNSPNFPLKSPLQGTLKGGMDGFITKLSNTGSSLVFSTYFGGSDSSYLSEEITSVAVDSAGNVYVGGHSTSLDFPTTPGAFRIITSGSEGFVSKLSPMGDQLLYSTMIGGSDGDGIAAIAVDSAGHVYAAGYTVSTDFYTTPDALQTKLTGGSDVFLVKLTASGKGLVYSTLIGGTGNEGAFSLAIDDSGLAYLGGYTDSSDFPLANPIQSSNAGGEADGFVAVIPTGGGGLLFSTYLGGTGWIRERVGSVAQHGGYVYGTGMTDSKDFPVVKAVQPKLKGAWEGFVFKLDPTADGIGNAKISLTPTSLTFANQKLNTSSAAQTVTLANIGANAISISNIATTGDFAQTADCVNSLASGAACSINVIFTPTTYGERHGQVTITDNAMGSPHNIPLTGTGTSSFASLSATKVDFGTQLPGVMAAPRVITLANIGNESMDLFGISVSGEFMMTSNCGSALAPGNGCSIAVSFHPITKGSYNGQIAVSHSAPGSPHIVSLSGTSADVSINPARPGRPNRPIAMSPANLGQVIVETDGKADVRLFCTKAPVGTSCSVHPAVVKSGHSSQTVSVCLTVQSKKQGGVPRLAEGTRYSVSVNASDGEDTRTISVPVQLQGALCGTVQAPEAAPVKQNKERTSSYRP